jgi:hypothetical protein
MGDRIGMMKFGSRLDIYLPTADVDVLVKTGDTVRAGETIVARCWSLDEKSMPRNRVANNGRDP